MARDFYDVLGVDRSASEEEIKRAYREKAAEYHPDVSDDPDAEEKFKEIQQAKEVLTDEEQRELYEQLGHERYLEFEKRGGTDADAGGQRRAGGPFGGAGGGDPFGDIFEQFFGASRQSRSRDRPQSGADLRTRMRIDLVEAYEGTTKRITVRRPEQCDDCGGTGHPPDAEARTCPECNGRGRITQVQQSPFGRVQREQRCDRCDGTGRIHTETCATCGGSGTVERERTLEVDVPAGIRDGQTLRMDGEGAPGERGGPTGDLLIEVTVDDHDTFDRDGDTLYYDLSISYPQAVLGDTVEIPTLAGSVELSIPAGTQPGDKFRIDDRGMPRLRGRGQGDLIVTVDLEVPTNVSEEQREAIERLAELDDVEIDPDESFFDKLKESF